VGVKLAAKADGLQLDLSITLDPCGDRIAARMPLRIGLEIRFHPVDLGRVGQR
jgi:hypothetical protein